MLHVVLVEPEIPQNTGNVARTCAATGCALHLVKPLGFSLEDRYLKRAGLDYWPLLDLTVHESFDAFWAAWGGKPFWLVSTKGAQPYTRADLRADACLLFGRETAGLPGPLLAAHPDRCLRIPIRAEARSLNLSNSVAVVVFEAMRQRGFAGRAP
ncbi:MAG: tRNA (uridine(34)/cytosine(34)/5-carboxymethylaminomethyluridine(34)-2'-O)-methyltransferase TrmL [Oscillospiraceae bacterium]|nr:tRNA (uridine(34)/cytosine(34)/5-carboxymethylaminomethyluridine(34)-2'-O)-methyltransferase TrmL [Oscillospiraceae bacterium]